MLLTFVTSPWSRPFSTTLPVPRCAAAALVAVRCEGHAERPASRRGVLRSGGHGGGLGRGRWLGNVGVDLAQLPGVALGADAVRRQPRQGGRPREGVRHRHPRVRPVRRVRERPHRRCLREHLPCRLCRSPKRIATELTWWVPSDCRCGAHDQACRPSPGAAAGVSASRASRSAARVTGLERTVSTHADRSPAAIMRSP